MIDLGKYLVFRGRCRKLWGRKGLFLLALLPWLLVTMAPHASAAEEVPVFTEPLAPVHFEEDGEVRGIATEIVRAIFREAGMEPRIEVYPWKRTYQKVLSTPGSFVYTINRTEKREHLFKWIGPILYKDVYLFKLRGRTDINISTLEEAKHYTTAVILGHSLTTMFMERGFREGKELIVTPNKEVQIKVFLRGRCDLITGNQYTIYEALRVEGHSLKDVEPAVFISSGGYYLGANRTVSDEAVERLRQANTKVQRSGLVEAIVNRYLQ